MFSGIQKLRLKYELPTQLFIVFFAYFLAHAGIFFTLNSIWWDDWILYGVSNQDIVDRFKMTGTFLGLVTLLHIFFQELGPVYYKITTFVLFYLNSIIFLLVARRQSWVTFDEALLVAVIFASAPLNLGRVMEISLPYTVCTFIFMLAWLLLIHNTAASALLFFISFVIPSHLVFYAIPVFELFLKENEKISIKKIVFWLVRRIHILCLPFVYFFLKNKYYPSSDLYAGYNQGLDFQKIIPALQVVWADLLGQEISLPLLGIFFIAAIFFIAPNVVINRRMLFLSVGFFALCLAMFPYLILGISPTFDEWPQSRHQLLMPIGISILAVGLIGFLKSNLRVPVLAFLLALSLSISIQFYDLVKLDWRKQEAVVKFLQDSDVRKADVFLFDDRTELTLRRTLAFYEWTGILRSAYGDQHRMGMRVQEYPTYKDGSYDKYFLSMYNAGSHKRIDDLKVVVIKVEYIKLVGEKPDLFGRQNYRYIITPSLLK